MADIIEGECFERLAITAADTPAANRYDHGAADLPTLDELDTAPRTAFGESAPTEHKPLTAPAKAMLAVALMLPGRTNAATAAQRISDPQPSHYRKS